MQENQWVSGFPAGEKRATNIKYPLFRAINMKTLGQPILFIRCPGSVEETYFSDDNERVGCFAFTADDCTLHGGLPCAEPAAQDHGFLRKNALIADPLASGGTGYRQAGKRQRAAFWAYIRDL